MGGMYAAHTVELFTVPVDVDDPMGAPSARRVKKRATHGVAPTRNGAWRRPLQESVQAMRPMIIASEAARRMFLR